MEAGIRAKTVAWLVVAVLACGLCYSLGFQTGVIQATQAATDRLDRINESLDELRAAQADTDTPDIADDRAAVDAS